jgi:two-component system cell cycle sensor histidine kinase/response regulator CckA
VIVQDILYATAGDSPVILIVDDDDQYAAFVREALLKSVGPELEMLHASTLLAAQAILETTRISVVLLDVHLPDGDALHWLRTRRSQIQAAVIVLTGDTHYSAGSPIVAGAQDFLVKSQIDPDQIVRSIRYAADRERTRYELLKSREYFQSLIERARDLITVVDEYGLVLYQSTASTRILGVAPEEFVGRSLFDLLSSAEGRVVEAMLSALFVGQAEESGGQLDLQHRDGTWRTLEVVASRIPSVSGKRRAVLNSRDITERRRAEDELRQAQRMDAIGRLAGGIAHDFSNVLTVVTGACENMRDAAISGRVADLAQIEAVLRNCGRASSLTRQLLAFSRQQTLAPEPLDLGALVGNTGQLLRQLIGEHIALSIDVAPDVRPIEADRVQVEQVLMNLAINARDAMGPGGALQIRVRNVEVSEAMAQVHRPMPAGPYVLLQVSDTGHGMTESIRARAFEPFFTTKAAGHGTGLGLSTVYGIVKQSGGYIWIESDPGKGATFSIYLAPVDAVPVNPMPKTHGLNGPVRAATILLTEDEADVRSLLYDMLCASGYTVIQATDAKDALNRADAYDGTIDLLLTDVVMPGGTGGALARAMVERRPNMKVLYMSGYPEYGSEPGTVLEPGVPFLPKPFTRDVLLEHVRALLI